MEDTVKNGKPPTLDERIAATIGTTDYHPADLLADLIRETDEQIDHCDQLGREMRDRSTNPAILDPAARGAAEDSEFRAARLRNGLARLRELHHEAELRQQLRDWHQNADLVEERAVKLADELLERWPAVTSWICDFLGRKSVVDAEIRAVNEGAPGFEARRLREIELVARGSRYDRWERRRHSARRSGSAHYRFRARRPKLHGWRGHFFQSDNYLSRSL
jgi:hypothetical protein